jgi:hypothetical protein
MIGLTFLYEKFWLVKIRYNGTLMVSKGRSMQIELDMRRFDKGEFSKHLLDFLRNNM